MQDILKEIVAYKHLELEQLCAKKVSLREALLQSESGIIAEFKRKSPSKGWIKEEGRADIIPLSYQQTALCRRPVWGKCRATHCRLPLEARLQTPVGQSPRAGPRSPP